MCGRMEHPEEPSIATVTVMNAIHLQPLSAAHLEAPCEEEEEQEEENKVPLYPLPVLHGSLENFVHYVPACASYGWLLLGFYVSLFLRPSTSCVWRKRPLRNILSRVCNHVIPPDNILLSFQKAELRYVTHASIPTIKSNYLWLFID